MVQPHKNFINNQVKELIQRYIDKKMGRKYVQEILGIKKTKIFILVKQVKENPENFSITYTRRIPTKRISLDTERKITKELKKGKELIENKILFRSFSITPPFQSTKDIFCLRAERLINAYRKISINKLEFRFLIPLS